MILILNSMIELKLKHNCEVFNDIINKEFFLKSPFYTRFYVILIIFILQIYFYFTCTRKQNIVNMVFVGQYGTVNCVICFKFVSNNEL